MQKLSVLAQKVIEYSFYLLFLTIPLVFYWKNYELFEYNKMMLTYAFTIIIATAWAIKSIINKKIFFQKSPFDKFLILFLISQIASTVFSMDVHVSIFGYYSRFHQGLLATISYLILYFAFTSNFPKEKIKNILYSSFTSAIIVSIWGIFEHFGHSASCLIITGNFDVNCWVQDVQTRIFATLGQPNWMSAYLAILIPVACSGAIYGTINKQSLIFANAQIKKNPIRNIFGPINRTATIILSILFYLALLFTRSRSGFVALWVGLIIFFIINFVGAHLRVRPIQIKKHIINFFGIGQTHRSAPTIITIILLSFTFLFGSGISQIDRFTISGLLGSGPKDSPEVAAPTSPALETGGTESGAIRQIVWRGAIDIFKHYPVFGSGVETFAYSYYQYRPVEHNMVSEWDFLYNKAHNEYLNFAATTGLFGFLTYMAFIIAFIIWFTKTNFGAANVFSAHSRDPLVGCEHCKKMFASQNLLNIALFCGWLTILITNFFGFSVVIVALYFYLIPAMVFVNCSGPIYGTMNKQSLIFANAQIKKNPIRNIFGPMNRTTTIITTILILIISSFLLKTLINFYLADINYATGLSLARNSKYKESYLYLTNAIVKNPYEPVYHDEISTTLANLAVSFASQKDEDSAKKFAALALKESDIATTISPNNVTFYKTKTKMFYTLSQLNEDFISRAIDALKRASELAPTDPKVKYNLAILEGKMNNLPESVKLLEEVVKLKPNYRDGHYALALMYKDSGETQKAKSELQYILTNLDSTDPDALEKLNSWE